MLPMQTGCQSLVTTISLRRSHISALCNLWSCVQESQPGRRLRPWKRWHRRPAASLPPPQTPRPPPPCWTRPATSWRARRSSFTRPSRRWYPPETLRVSRGWHRWARGWAGVRESCIVHGCPLFFTLSPSCLCQLSAIAPVGHCRDNSLTGCQNKNALNLWAPETFVYTHWFILSQSPWRHHLHPPLAPFKEMFSDIFLTTYTVAHECFMIVYIFLFIANQTQQLFYRPVHTQKDSSLQELTWLLDVLLSHTFIFCVKIR